MAIRHVKPTKQLEQELVKFNRVRKQQGATKLTIEQYIKYLTGKGLPEHKKPKIIPLKSIPAVPSWANSTKNIPSNSDRTYHPSKPDTRYKQEVSKKFVVSIPYNKGGYQVLLDSEIQNAGKKV